MKNLPVHQLERDQQAPDTPVSIEEGVDGLELHMRQCTMHQHRQTMEKGLQAIERAPHLMRRWRHEDGLAERDVARADPVLRRAELARDLVAPRTP